MLCDICATEMRRDILPETFHCPSCGFYKSSLAVQINASARIDETAREQALKPIRTANFRQILDECGTLIPAGGTLLDVGCAHGWFMEAATARGFKAVGIEPDIVMAKRAMEAGNYVKVGLFPEVLGPDEKFDAISFNDVFEHLPDVISMANAVHAHLRPGGVAIINLPVSEGVVFRTARIAARAGFTGPLQRMWQQGLPSPHLSYFSAETLGRLMQRAGFSLLRQGSIEAIATDGLYERIRYDKKMSAAKASAYLVAAHIMRAVGHVAPSDINYFAFRKIEASH